MRTPDRDVKAFDADVPVSRRTILRAGAVAATMPASSQPVEQKDGPLPMGVLGRTGVKITRLVMGASFPDYGPRLLGFAHRSGIRAFDNSYRYVGGRGEGLLGQWVNQLERRDDVFVMTKGRSRDPDGLYGDVVSALEKMKLDTIDLFMLHGLEDPAITLDRTGQWRRLKDRLRRENKVRFMGFSTHAEMSRRIACLETAAQGGWLDAVLLACDPGLIRADTGLNKAIDACAKAGVGLIAMKTGRGLGKATLQPTEAIEQFKPLQMSPHQAMQVGIYSDERFAAVCTEMPSRRLIAENSQTARQFTKPLTPQQWKMLEEAVQSLSRATCPGCDGSCRRAGKTCTDFDAIARYLAYYEEDGNRQAARTLYARLKPAQRSWKGADLKAASCACSAKLDFEAILNRAEQLLA